MMLFAGPFLEIRTYLTEAFKQIIAYLPKFFEKWDKSCSDQKLVVTKVACLKSRAYRVQNNLSFKMFPNSELQL